MSSADYDALAPEQQVLAESFDVPTAKRGDSLLDVIKYAKPTMLIGASTVAGLFTEEVVKAFHEGLRRQTDHHAPCRTPPPNAKCLPATPMHGLKENAFLPVGVPSTLWNMRAKVLPLPVQQHVRVSWTRFGCFGGRS